LLPAAVEMKKEELELAGREGGMSERVRKEEKG
jgi:hypothetical protein